MKNKNQSEKISPEGAQANEQINSVVRSKKLTNLSTLGKVLYYLGMVKLNESKLNKWHPLTWVYIFIIIIGLPIICMFIRKTAIDILMMIKNGDF